MGRRGPVPKRDAESVRRRGGGKSGRTKGTDADRVESFSPCTMPPPPEDWHEGAASWYLSLDQSGQSKFYEPSDWQYALATGTMLSTLLGSSRPSAELFKAVMQAMDLLGTTEVARRRARIEVDRPKKPDAKPAAEKKSRIADRFAELAAQ